MNKILRFPQIALFGFATSLLLPADQTTWTFSNPVAPLAPGSGTATLNYFDPFESDWGQSETIFSKASGLSLPLMDGSDVDVMAFPACTPEQGYTITHGFSPNGSLGTSGLVSNYTVVMDILFPSTSDAGWRSLLQTDSSNSSDGDLFVENSPSGGIGISANYRGSLTPDTWHRVVWVMRAAPGEGQAHRYLDGQFVGAIGTTGSGLDARWGLTDDLLLFTDENNETAPGYVSSISIIDRKLSYGEVLALGGPSPDGADVPGPLAGPFTELMSRPVKTLGHRGSSGCAPENTLAAINQSFLDGAVGTEIDTRITSDGVVIAFHDETVDRTTDGSGTVNSLTLAEIKELDAGSWFGPDFIGEKVPTLTEVLVAARGRGIIYLDIKTEGQAQGFADAVSASDFPLEDLWFWTPGNRNYAAEIRAAIPGAQIVWGGPGDWQTDPNYFSDLRDLGVIGFSFGQGGASLEFSQAAKSEGFFVEVFTILDPVQMRTAADRGVDFIETDFPNVLEAIQPPQLTVASAPKPPSDSMDLVGPQILSWISGESSTSHRIHFGTTDPPEFIMEQSHDLYKTPDLARDTTYYWRIDEVTPDGVETGAVWSFTTRPAPVDPVIYEWHLEGDLAPASGDAVLGFASGALTEDEVAFEATDGAGIPHMADGPTGYLRVPAFFDPTQGLDLTFVTTPPNGGGDFINQYSFIYDIFVPNGLGWLPFFNTDPDNNSDGDFFGRAGGGLGIAALGYAPDGSLREGEWQRVIFTADLESGQVAYYVDGIAVLRRTGDSLLDGRFSLYSSLEEGPHVRLLNDNDGETTEVLVGAIAFLDQTIDDISAAELGTAKASGIFASKPVAANLSATYDFGEENYILTWDVNGPETYTVETSTDLTNWSEAVSGVQGSDGKATVVLPVSGFQVSSNRFFRIFPD